jgi:hypothetical protein
MKDLINKSSFFIKKNLRVIVAITILIAFAALPHDWILPILFGLIILSFLIALFISDFKKSSDKGRCEFCYGIFDLRKLKRIKLGIPKYSCPKCNGKPMGIMAQVPN